MCEIGAICQIGVSAGKRSIFGGPKQAILAILHYKIVMLQDIALGDIH